MIDILDEDEHVTILLVDKTTIVIIYMDSYRVPKMEWVILFVILMSQQTKDHMMVFKGKGQNTS